jgi:carboxypeptidase Taq
LDNSKKIAEYCAESNADLYDYMLDVYEPGMSKKDYDEFFDMYKKEIIPLVKELNNNPKPNDAFLNLDYDLNKQREFTQEIMNYLGADKNRFYCGETEHPFSNQISMGDVRIATKYTLNNMIDNVFSVIHELGHGFFQAYIDPKYAFTPIENNISMGLHESQSRFLENYLARRKSF